MKINNIYWYFKGVLSKRFCEELIQYGKQKEDKIALTGGLPNVEDLSKKQLKDLKKKRDSNIVWMGEQWIFKEILPYVSLANKNAGWNFDWDYSEDCQFTKYTKGQFYNWHQDSFDKPFNNPNKLMLHNKIRKLSVTCSLSDPSTYSGGELEFYEGSPERASKKNMFKCTEISEQGSIVVFPSFMWHRVCPVTEGTRYSLVIWNCGKEFK
jgi:PKHD-type hydroxylase|tara:strand:+ start:87 stop:716 length:630 start_codon:yes stop_codon:yes gene_type:complete